MSKITLAILFSTTLLISLSHAKMQEGKKLFDEAKCMECHNTEDFQHKKEKVNNFQKLSDTIHACAFNNDTGWFDEEVHEVAKYLNKNHYHYKVIQHKKD